MLSMVGEPWTTNDYQCFWMQQVECDVHFDDLIIDSLSFPGKSIKVNLIQPVLVQWGNQVSLKKN